MYNVHVLRMRANWDPLGQQTKSSSSTQPKTQLSALSRCQLYYDMHINVVRM